MPYLHIKKYRGLVRSHTGTMYPIARIFDRSPTLPILISEEKSDTKSAQMPKSCFLFQSDITSSCQRTSSTKQNTSGRLTFHVVGKGLTATHRVHQMAHLHKILPLPVL